MVCPCCIKFFPERAIAPLPGPTDVSVANDAQAKNVVKGEDQVEGVTTSPASVNNTIEKFFEQKYAPTLFQSMNRRLLIFFTFAVLISICLAFAVQIKASEKDFRAESFPNSTNLMRSINVRSRFDGQDELQVGTFCGVWVLMVWTP